MNLSIKILIYCYNLGKIYKLCIVFNNLCNSLIGLMFPTPPSIGPNIPKFRNHLYLDTGSGCSLIVIQPQNSAQSANIKKSQTSSATTSRLLSVRNNRSRLFQVEEEGDTCILHVIGATHLDGGRVWCTASPTTSGCCEPMISCSTELSVVGALLDVDRVHGVGDASSMEVISEGGDVYVGRRDEPAQVIRGPQDTTALAGDRVLLKATYTGRPEPAVRWTRAVSIKRIPFNCSFGSGPASVSKGGSL